MSLFGHISKHVLCYMKSDYTLQFIKSLHMVVDISDNCRTFGSRDVTSKVKMTLSPPGGHFENVVNGLLHKNVHRHMLCIITNSEVFQWLLWSTFLHILMKMFKSS